MSTLSSKNVKTKKEHTCYSCGRPFPKGTKMNYWAGLYEGDFCAVYSCMTCVEIMNMSDETAFPEGYVYEILDKGQTPEQFLEQCN